MFNFGIKQAHEEHFESQSQWLRVEYADGHFGWLWRNLRGFEEQQATWIALQPPPVRSHMDKGHMSNQHGQG